MRIFRLLSQTTGKRLYLAETGNRNGCVTIEIYRGRNRMLSVHQNTFPDGKYHGAQVFYSNGELSQPLAQLTQETLRAALDPGNTREAKPIPDSVYLMNHITCPAILVECGFLSNAEEDLLLQSGAYQTKLASALAASWLQWLDEEGRGEGFSLQKGGVASE